MTMPCSSWLYVGLLLYIVTLGVCSGLNSQLFWAYFADKDCTSSATALRFLPPSGPASSIGLTAEAVARRIKNRGVEHYADLRDVFVCKSYVDAVKDTLLVFGGHVRRESKWLNAVSFYVPSSVSSMAIEALKRLTCVTKITPVLLYTDDRCKCQQRFC